jgi:hypothetical protein
VTAPSDEAASESFVSTRSGLVPRDSRVDQWRVAMAQVTPPQCVGIANEIEALEAERAGLQQELAGAPPSMKPFILREIRRLNVEIGQLRQQLLLCEAENPPALRPDLAARTVRLRVNHSTRKLGVAALIKNIGRGNAYGPFRIDLAATLYRGGATTSFVQSFQVPPGVIIYGEPVLAPPDRAQPEQPAEAAVFPGPIRRIPPGEIWSQEYVTEDMVVPLFYRDESPSATYEFDFIVDSEQQVSEPNEGNNHFFVRWWTTLPASVLRTTPLEIDAKDGTVTAMDEGEPTSGTLPC